jgi:predicted anti-sigma-YlaC factor YlaD
MECRDFHELMQEYLDGEPRRDAVSRHLQECPRCRAAYSGIHRLAEGLGRLTPVQPPPALADRITRMAVARYQSRLRWRRGILTTAALAASILLALVLIPAGRHRNDLPPAASVPVAAKGSAPAGATVSLDQSLQDARAALVSLVGRTADQAVAQGRPFIPSAAPTPMLAGVALWPQPLGPPVRTLGQASQQVSAGLQPVAASARRAVDLWLREIPSDDEK